jgi:hypothetical protein
MKRLLALTVFAIASHATSAFDGESVFSSKEVVVPAPPPPVSYFQSNEFSVGLFASYGWTHNDNVRAIGNHAWGGFSREMGPQNGISTRQKTAWLHGCLVNPQE